MQDSTMDPSQLFRRITGLGEASVAVPAENHDLPAGRQDGGVDVDQLAAGLPGDLARRES
jgi:hypothetical protein